MLDGVFGLVLPGRVDIHLLFSFNLYVLAATGSIKNNNTVLAGGERNHCLDGLERRVEGEETGQDKTRYQGRRHGCSYRQLCTAVKAWSS